MNWSIRSLEVWQNILVSSLVFLQPLTVLDTLGHDWTPICDNKTEALSAGFSLQVGLIPKETGS